MLRLCCDALDALCGCEFSTTGVYGVEFATLLRCVLTTTRTNREQHNSGARVLKSLGDLSAHTGLEFCKQLCRAVWRNRASAVIAGSVEEL